MSKIEFFDAGFRYGDGADVFAQARLALASGSFHCLTGPSGAGKTTFLRLCYLDLKPTSGRISVFGEDVGSLGRDGVADIRRRIGVIHQDCAFLNHLSVAENVALPLRLDGRIPEDHKGELQDLLKWVGLDARKDATPAELSGGERQRAALARAVMLSPDIILADEPTGNIDWDMGQRMMTLLAELGRMGKTILVATHDLPLVRAVSKLLPTRILRLSGGRVTQGSSDL